MTFDEYQKKALTTAILQEDEFKNLAHWVLGLVGETGEIAEKFKKIIRDKNGVVTEEDKTEIIKEAGDVLWYVAVLADSLGYSIKDVAEANIAKLASRKQRGTLHGSGDNR